MRYSLLEKREVMDDYPVLNTELMEKTMTYIKDHPAEHDQGSWGLETACGTTYCFAGTALLLSGKFAVKFDEPDWNGNKNAVFYPLDGGPVRYAEAQAGDILGLTMKEKDILFYADTDEDTLPLEEAFKRVMNGEYRD